MARKKSAATKAPAPVKVFISYSNRDRELLEQLLNHLQPLVALGLIALYYDLASLKPGDDLIKELLRLLSEAQVALFLVSPDSLSSQHVQREAELALVERESKLIIPIVLRPCDWFRSPLAIYNALPTGAKPVTTWEDRDEAFADIVHGLHRVIESIQRTREPGALPAKHEGRVNAIAVSPDGRLVVSAGSDGLAILCDSATFQPIGALSGHRAALTGVQISPDGEFAATCSTDATVKVWDLGGRRELRTLEGHTERVTAVSFTQDGRSLVSGSWDGTIKVWDVETGRLMRSVQEPVPVFDVVPMGGELAVSVRRGALAVWDLQSLGRPRLLPGSAVGLCAMTDGGHVIAWEEDKFAIQSIDDGRSILNVEAPSIIAVRVLANGRHAVSAHSDGLKLWDLANGTMIRSVNLGRGKPTALAVTPDGARAIWGSESGGIFAWPIDLSVARPLPTGHDRLRLAYLAVLESPSLWRVLETWDESALSGIGAQLGVPPDQDVLEALAARRPNAAPQPLWAAWMETLYPAKLGKPPGGS